MSGTNLPLGRFSVFVLAFVWVVASAVAQESNGTETSVATPAQSQTQSGDMNDGQGADQIEGSAVAQPKTQAATAGAKSKPVTVVTQPEPETASTSSPASKLEQSSAGVVDESSGDDGQGVAKSPGLPDKLTVASWGGAYQESQKLAYFKPFQSDAGIEISAVVHELNNAGEPILFGENIAQWDVADMPAHIARASCAEGLLLKIHDGDLVDAPNGGAARGDFLGDTLTECAVPNVAWSSVIVVDRSRFKKKKPKTLRDFFKPKVFKGKRALPRQPHYVLEMALMADGVAPDEVYVLLATRDGQKRAFDKLEALRGHIVWWDKGNEPLQMLKDRTAVMAMAYSGRAFLEVVRRSDVLQMIWDGQIYDHDVWVISKNSANEQAARRFVSFATSAERMAEQASRFPYGPMRISALDLVGNHPVLGIEMSPYLPTTPGNLERALQIDTAWWEKNRDALDEKFTAWIKGKLTFEVQSDDSSSVSDNSQISTGD